MAVWKQDGCTVKKSTGIRVKEAGMTPAKAEALARQTAEAMEAAAKGETACSRALNAVRAAAATFGGAAQIASVRDYLAGIPCTGTEHAEINRRRAFKLFLEHLGAAAARGLDTVTPAMCEAFIREKLKVVSKGTAEGYKVYLSAAFNRAVKVDAILDRNPWQAVNVSRLAYAVNPERGLDKAKRQPFTIAEITTLIHELPAPWCDMVAVSWLACGLRLSDVCRLRWDDINWERGYIYLVEKKTKKERFLPLTSELADRLEGIRERGASGEYVFPAMAHFYNNGCQGYISTQFTALLRAHGIIPADVETIKDGKRHRVSPKSFHSIRHAVVSLLRADGAFSADVVRDAVGHDSEAVERGYFTGTTESRSKVGSFLGAAIRPHKLYAAKTA